MLVAVKDRLINEVFESCRHFLGSAAQKLIPHEVLCFPLQVDRPFFKQKSVVRKHSTQTIEVIKINTNIFSFILKFQTVLYLNIKLFIKIFVSLCFNQHLIINSLHLRNISFGQKNYSSIIFKVEKIYSKFYSQIYTDDQ